MDWLAVRHFCLLLFRMLRYYLLRLETAVAVVLVCGVWLYLRRLDQHVRQQVAMLEASRLRLRERRPSLVRNWIESSFLSIRDLGQASQTWELQHDKVSVYAVRGVRMSMEDRFNILIDREKWGMKIYGIFDGHGGEFAADFAERSLLQAIVHRIEEHNHGHSPNLSKILIDEIKSVDAELVNVTEALSNMAGTTALVAILHAGLLTVANVGDSRGVLCDKDGRAVPLSTDHKPNMEKERTRIQKAGGFVAFNGVWRVAGILATSRALGDYFLKKPSLVIPDPDILSFDLAEQRPQFFILATDGLWDVVSNQDAVDFIRSRLHEPFFGGKALVEHALKLGSLDNVSVMIVTLNDADYAKSVNDASPVDAQEVVHHDAAVDDSV